MPISSAEEPRRDIIFCAFTRGTAYGLYNAAIGVMALPASILAGVLWHRISPAAPFAFGALLAGLALIGLWFVPSPPVRRVGASS